jgi:hypothetical protein
MRRRDVLWLVTLAATLPVIHGAGGCASRQTPSEPDLTAEAARRLDGRWVLESFQPEARLEPMLSGLLAAQFGNLVVEFRAGTMTAVGPGVSTTRSYRVVEAQQDRLKVVVTDEQSVTYSAYGRFVNGRVEFQPTEAPWRGRGVLVRAR